jgi:hypothetical protein
MQIQYFDEMEDEMIPPDMREPFRVGFERAAFRRTREFAQTVEKDTPVIAVPYLPIVTMSTEELMRLPTLGYK